MSKPEDITAYEAQVLIGTSISGCTMTPDRTFDLKAAWARLYAMKLIDRADGLAIATPEGSARIAAMLSPEIAIMAAEKRGEEREREACAEMAVYGPPGDYDWHPDSITGSCGKRIAAAIRNRSNP